MNEQTAPDEAVAPAVSILIPVHNRLEMTRACLESIFANADSSPSFEILVVDDGSTDGTAAYLDSLAPRVRALPSATRESFAQKMNRAAPLAHGEFLCLLNNDTLVTPGWLANLLAAAQRDSGIGVVGNLQLTPGTERINHAGMVFDAQGNSHHLYEGQPADFWPARISREFQIVTAACWLVRKRVFLELGGFDPGYVNGFEDVDFCLRARQSGYAIFYAGDSVIYHHGSSTPGRTDHEPANAARFKSKWQAAIVPDLEKFYLIPPVPPTFEIAKRYAYIEELSERRPVIASFLRTIIRLVTSVAKRL